MIYKTARVIELGIRLDSSGLLIPSNGNLTLYIPDLHFDNLILSRKFIALSSDKLIYNTAGNNTIVLLREVLVSRGGNNLNY